jgi:hypothetical protein
VGLILHTQGILKYIDLTGHSPLREDWVPVPRFHSAFRRNIRDRLRSFGPDRPVHRGRQRPALDRNPYGNRDDQDPRTVPPGSRLLVYGERREDGLRDDDDLVFTDRCRSWIMVPRRVVVGTKAAPDNLTNEFSRANVQNRKSKHAI